MDHTTGPWKWFVTMLCTESVLDSTGTPQIVMWPQNAIHAPANAAQLLGACGHETEIQADANARLMAAAPTMYDRIRELELQQDDLLVACDKFSNAHRTRSDDERVEVIVDAEAWAEFDQAATRVKEARCQTDMSKSRATGV